MTIALATMIMKNDDNDVKTFLLNNLKQSINGSHFSQIQYMKKTLKIDSNAKSIFKPQFNPLFKYVKFLLNIQSKPKCKILVQTLTQSHFCALEVHPHPLSFPPHLMCNF
jgi:hypothetical protein